jgi:hypothetical protein
VRRRLGELQGAGTIGGEARNLALLLLDYERRKLAKEPDAALGLLRGMLRRMRIDAPLVAALAELPLGQAHEMLEGKKLPGPRLAAKLVELSAFPLSEMMETLAVARRGARGRPPAAPPEQPEPAAALARPEPVAAVGEPDALALAVATVAARRPGAAIRRAAAPQPVVTPPPVRRPRPEPEKKPAPPPRPVTVEVAPPPPPPPPAAEEEAEEERPLSPVEAVRQRMAARRQLQRGGRGRR